MSIYYVGSIPYSNELFHHGVKGMHWGVRHDYKKIGSKNGRNGSAENSNGLQKAKQSSSKAGSFVSKHKKGIAIAGALLAAGIAGIAISKINSGSKEKGHNVVEKLLSNNQGYNSKGTVFSVKGDKGGVSGYYSPDYANFLRKMNGGSLPGAHAKQFRSMTKEVYDFNRKKH